MNRKLLFTILAAISFNASAALVCDTDNLPPVIWYVGQPTDPIHALSFDTGAACFATGKELLYIQQHFTGIHFKSNAGVVEWYDDDAQFIVGNL